MVLSSRRPGRNSKLQQIPLSEILRQGSFLFQAEGLALFRAKGSIPIGRGGHARAFFPIALSRLTMEFSTTTSQVGFTVFCITNQERKSKKPSKTATDWELVFIVRFPFVSMVVIPALSVVLNPPGARIAYPPALFSNPMRVKS